MHKGNDGGDEEEDAVHDAKGPASLEHGAGLVGAPVPAGASSAPSAAADGPVVAARDGHAVGVADAAQVPDAGDEGAHEAEVDDADEERIGRRPVVAEEGEDGPREGENRHDEEDENRLRREDVVLVVAVNEPGEHAHGGELKRVSLKYFTPRTSQCMDFVPGGHVSKCLPE